MGQAKSRTLSLSQYGLWPSLHQMRHVQLLSFYEVVTYRRTVQTVCSGSKCNLQFPIWAMKSVWVCPVHTADEGTGRKQKQQLI